jgi:hypothetical protein
MASIRFEFAVLVDTESQAHRFDFAVPGVVIGPMPLIDDLTTARLLNVTRDELRAGKSPFAILTSRAFEIGDADSRQVVDTMRARWLRTVPPSLELHDIPLGLMAKLARLQFDVRDSALFTMWETVIEAWTWVAEDFDPATFPDASPVDVQLWPTNVAAS